MSLPSGRSRFPMIDQIRWMMTYRSSKYVMCWKAIGPSWVISVWLRSLEKANRPIQTERKRRNRKTTLSFGHVGCWLSRNFDTESLRLLTILFWQSNQDSQRPENLPDSRWWIANQSADGHWNGNWTNATVVDNQQPVNLQGNPSTNAVHVDGQNEMFLAQTDCSVNSYWHGNTTRLFTRQKRSVRSPTSQRPRHGRHSRHSRQAAGRISGLL